MSLKKSAKFTTFFSITKKKQRNQNIFFELLVFLHDFSDYSPIQKS